MATASSTGVTTMDMVLATLSAPVAQKLIFSRLSLDDGMSARRVNKQWKALVDPLIEYKVRLSDDTKLYVVNCDKNRPMSLFIGSFVGKYPEGGLAHLDVKGIKIDAKNGSSGISANNFRKVMADFKNVQILNVASPAVKYIRDHNLFAKLNLPNLNRLVLLFADDGTTQLIPVLLNRFPNLKKVQIANLSAFQNDPNSIYSHIYGFLARHNQLEEVSLMFPEGLVKEEKQFVFTTHWRGKHFEKASTFRPRNDYRLAKNIHDQSKPKLEKLQLKNLSWNLSIMEGHVGRHDMLTTLLTNQIQLCELNLENLSMQDMSVWNKLVPLLEKCSGTLSSLSIKGCFCNSLVANRRRFNCSWIKNCTKLKILSIQICGMQVDSLDAIPLSVTDLNSGPMMTQDQIEALALRMINLESWTLPQKGRNLSGSVPRISLYLFKVITHLPKINTINIFQHFSAEKQIEEYVKSEEGLLPCANLHDHCDTDEEEDRGRITYHIDHKTFSRNHQDLQQFMENYQPAPGEDDDDGNRFCILCGEENDIRVTPPLGQ